MQLRLLCGAMSLKDFTFLFSFPVIVHLSRDQLRFLKALDSTLFADGCRHLGPKRQ